MERSDQRAEAEISYATLVVKVSDRDALPVRAIPYVTGWTMSPDVVANEFARSVAAPFERFKNTSAHHLQGGRAVQLLPKEWDAYVAALDGLEAELRDQFQNDDQGYAAWVSRSVTKLPAGVFVWLDEFTADFHRAYGTDRLTILGERPGDRDLNLSPYLEDGTLNMVLEGFATRTPPLTHHAADIVAGLAERGLNGRPIDWRCWVENKPALNPAEAARLMAGLDPELFEHLSARPVQRNDPSRACAEAKRIERTALADGRDRHTPDYWLQWAKEHDFTVHRGFFLAVQGRHLVENEKQVLAEMPRAEAFAWERAIDVGGGSRQVVVEYARHVTTVIRSFPDFCAEVEERLARWRRGRYELIEAAQVIASAEGMDAGQLAEQMDDAIHSGKLTYRMNNIPLNPKHIPSTHLWIRIVFQQDVNDWLTVCGAGYSLSYPYPPEAQGYVPLERTLLPYFELPSAQLPKDIATLVRKEYDLFNWDEMVPLQRLSLAQQKDMQSDPALEQVREFYWNQTVREHELTTEISTVKSKATPTMGDYSLQQQRLQELGAELARVRARTWPGELESDAPAAVTSSLVTTNQEVTPPAARTPPAHQVQPRFSMSRAALVRAHLREWPTIEADLKDASKNGLAAAKAGKRDWNEQTAVDWARSKAKLVVASEPVARLDGAMRNLSTLPAKRNRLRG